jgi:NDP-sugar pyrophosphorylase family protein
MKINKAVFPVAGMGTRFLPATKAVPKELLPIVDTPALQLIIDEAVGAGIEHVVVVTSHAKPAIEAGVAAGALTGWLSGSGSSVLCVARPKVAAKVGKAMAAAFATHKLAGTIHLLYADNEGLRILKRVRR